MGCRQTKNADNHQVAELQPSGGHSLESTKGRSNHAADQLFPACESTREAQDLDREASCLSKSSVVSGQGSSYTENLPLEAITRTRKKKLTPQASGHGGMNFVKQYAGKHDFKTGVPDFILKAFDPAEDWAYKQLDMSGNQELRRFTANCCGEVAALDGTPFLKLSNLLKSFHRGPNVMDCKIGVRSFTEDEVGKLKMREDLYKRLVALDPGYATPEEHACQACTKYRWMNFNDEFTTLRDLGFRIDGITSAGSKLAQETLHSPGSLTELAHCIIEHFLPRPEADDRTQHGFSPEEVGPSLQQQVATNVRRQLEILLQAFKSSQFIASHSIIGSSLLFAVDADGYHSDVFWIDLAKVQELPVGTQITHDRQWVRGNHEDGLFLGVNNMIRCWKEVERLLEKTESQEYLQL